MKVVSAHFGALRSFSIRSTQRLGCKGSWVQIPPRRPFISYTYLENSVRALCLVFLSFAYRYFTTLGANSAHALTRFSFHLLFGFEAQGLSTNSDYLTHECKSKVAA